MASYICADCGKKTKRTHLKKLHHDDGTLKWVCLECYATYPDDEDEEEEAITKSMPKVEVVELLRQKEPKKDSVEVINLKGQLEEAEEVRDKNYEKYTEMKGEFEMMKKLYRDDVVAADLKNFALNEKYKKLNWLVKNKAIMKYRWFGWGFMVGSAIIATIISLINYVGW